MACVCSVSVLYKVALHLIVISSVEHLPWNMREILHTIWPIFSQSGKIFVVTTCTEYFNCRLLMCFQNVGVIVIINC